MEERQKIRKDIKDSLLTYRNFNKFWVNYKRGVIIYYLVRGPLELYARRDLWQDRFYLISLIAITFNMLIGFILSLIFSSLAITSLVLLQQKLSSKNNRLRPSDNHGNHHLL
jgi:DMSO/TMAO reductase YedYZ heme-binding membrane subunit